MLILGIDEAGYGPRLGPLVVSASLWQRNDGRFTPLEKSLSAQGLRIADSKKIYHSSSGLKPLELELLPVLSFLRTPVLPLFANSDDIEDRRQKFSHALQTSKTELGAMSSRVVDAAEFNRLLCQYGDNKATMLSELSLQLVRERIDAALNTVTDKETALNILVLCDKHGGRNDYRDILSRHFPDSLVLVRKESRSESVYRIAAEQTPETPPLSMEFRFTAKGESQLPVALASMLSKYRREVAMIAFNEFWRKHCPGIAPTAGYPVDAERFHKETAAARQRLDISDDDIWRKK